MSSKFFSIIINDIVNKERTQTIFIPISHYGSYFGWKPKEKLSILDKKSELVSDAANNEQFYKCENKKKQASVLKYYEVPKERLHNKDQVSVLHKKQQASIPTNKERWDSKKEQPSVPTYKEQGEQKRWNNKKEQALELKYYEVSKERFSKAQGLVLNKKELASTRTNNERWGYKPERITRTTNAEKKEEKRWDNKKLQASELKHNELPKERLYCKKGKSERASISTSKQRWDNLVVDVHSIFRARRFRMAVRKLLLLSSSVTGDNTNYLEYAKDSIQRFLRKHSVVRVLFVPYALPDYDKYEQKVLPAFKDLGFELKSIHHAEDPQQAIRDTDAVFIGGGNTFLLLKTLYDKDLVKPIRHMVLEKGMPYVGSSAGTNCATINICTTNDMPIVFPPTFEALNLVPFNINPHYIEMKKGENKHMGETRDERIEQFLQMPGVRPVVGLQEGCILKVHGNSVTVDGVKGARLFRPNAKPFDYKVGDELSFLMNEFDSKAD